MVSRLKDKQHQRNHTTDLSGSRVLVSFETIPPAQVNYDTRDTPYTCSASDFEDLCSSALARHDLSRAKQSANSRTYDATVVYRFLALALHQPPTAIFPLNLLASSHSHVDSWDHERRTRKRTDPSGP